MPDHDAGFRSDCRGFSTAVLAPLLTLSFLCAAAHAESQPSPVLTVRSVAGSAWVEGAGRSTPLRPGQHLAVDEAVELGVGARVRLVADTGERLELGPLSQFAVEKRPAGDAPASPLQIRLDRGAMRLDSRKAATTSRFAIAAGSHRLQAGPGEYLVDSADASVTGCTVLGTLAYDGDAVDTDMVLGGGTTRCRQLERNGPKGSGSFAANPEQLAYLARTLTSGSVMAPPISGAARDAAPTHDADVAATAPRAVPTTAAPTTTPRHDPSTQDSSATTQASSGGLAAVRSEPAIPAPPLVAAEPLPAISPEIVASRDQSEPLTNPDPQIAPSPDIAPPETEPAHPTWIVNVASFPDHALAERAVSKLKDAGFVATIREEIVRARTSYRVVVAGLASEEQATSATRRLVKELGFTTAWTLRTG